MPWNNQSGGGGPWGQRGGSGGGGPWGGSPQGGGTPPDWDTIIRRGQDRLKDILPGGNGVGGKGIVIIVLAAIAIWLLTGFYTVRPNEVGINLVFGKYVSMTQNGWQYNWPAPVGEVLKPDVTLQRRIEIGYRSTGGRRSEVLDESLMLTGDHNIVHINFDVVWHIRPTEANDYVFNFFAPEKTIKAVGESAMREVVGRSNIQDILTTEQTKIATEVRDIIQHGLNSYKTGVEVDIVQLQVALPPEQVRQAFFDVNAAQQDADRAINEARAKANSIVPEARGRAAQIVQQAEAYRDQVTAEATGQAARFTQVYEQYKKAPAVIRERIFLETMEQIFADANKTIIDVDGNGGQGVVPYLPLSELQRGASGK